MDALILTLSPLIWRNAITTIFLTKTIQLVQSQREDKFKNLQGIQWEQCTYQCFPQPGEGRAYPRAFDIFVFSVCQ